MSSIARSALESGSIIQGLADGCIYETQHVFRSLSGSYAVTDYLSAQFVFIQRMKGRVTWTACASVASSRQCPQVILASSLDLMMTAWRHGLLRSGITFNC